ncbi:MAG: YbjQ family protein [Faecalibacterium sp.]
MKVKDIAGLYNLDNYQFEKFLRNQKDPLGYIQETSTGLSIEDLAVQSFVDSFNSYQAEEEAKRVLREKAEAEKEMAMSRMLISSGFTFEGYRIVKYSGYISGDDAIQVDRGTHGFFSSVTNVGESLMVSLKQMRRQALKELKEAAYDLGCNAIIGVDFDYITLEPETANSSGGTTYLPYVFGVTANGNAVIIEKIETNIETN